MARTFTMQKSFPGYPAGTVLTQGDDAHYHSDDGLFWMAADVVEQDDGLTFIEPAAFWKPVPTKDGYWFVNDYSQVEEAVFDGGDQDVQRIAVGNFFKTQEQAAAVRDKLKAVFQDVSPKDRGGLTVEAVAIPVGAEVKP